ncbi:phosphoribosylanthranilate isomerase [Dysgonomonas sp. 511]|uniref:phosphoribosylanthranilate isomerase n=1 Tax=Dysgonomonas sp. 511 TaxID=2302930 RepID=UPI0034CE6CF5
MKYPHNIKELNALPINLMGMIFYNKSPRYIDNLEWEDIRDVLHPEIGRAGVFVNAGMDYILQMAEKYRLGTVQLHGNELPEFCKELATYMPVIKAFSIAEASDFEQAEQYEAINGYFLFDTKTPQYGGSGQKFDWNILDNYQGDTPFLLSGGISADDVEAIRKIKHPKFAGVDLNSRFETQPGMKDIKQLQQFIKALNDEQD